MTAPIITLTTDFGSSGSYVASMKGVILGLNPAAAIVDVSHEVGPQNVREAALLVAQVVPYFPAGTIHVVVVDPEVGTQRRLLCLRTRGQLFLAPDNGVLSWAARGEVVEAFDLRQRRYWRPDVSRTFHGRDILAPVAAHLSLGVAPADLGPTVADWVRLPWPAPSRGASFVQGEILAVDRFGNLITSLSSSDIPPVDRAALTVECGGRTIVGLVSTYADVGEGEIAALVGSSGLLEVAARNGSASAELATHAGAAVRVRW